MNDQDFIDYYELLELSPNANAATVERVFRYMAKQHHPDTSPTNDRSKFNALVSAYEILRDPAKRAAYDAQYDQQQQAKIQIAEGANQAGNDCIERYKLLSILYAQRRRDFKKPGIGLGSLERLIDFPPEVMEFHIWYFREKDWIAREEGGQFAITAKGVDHIETMNKPTVSNHMRLEDHTQQLIPETV